MNKTRSTVFAMALLASLPAASVSAEESPSLTAAERAEIVQMLHDSRAETETLAARATGDAWNLQPAADKWSVGGIVEHLARTEESIFELARAALNEAPEADWQTLSEGGHDPLIQNLRDRTRKFQAPEVLQPTGEKDRTATLQWYASNRITTLDFVLGTEDPLQAHFAEGPPGKLSVDRWLVLIAAHNQRHNAQIREVLDWIAAGAEPTEAGSASNATDR